MLDKLACCMLSDDLQRYHVGFSCDAIALEQLNSQEHDRLLLEYNTKMVYMCYCTCPSSLSVFPVHAGMCAGTHAGTHIRILPVHVF